MAIVTIGGNLGSGAPEIGKMVADRLQIDYIDRQIMAGVAERLQRKEEEVIAKEMPPNTLFGRVAEALGRNYALGDAFAGAYLPVGQLPLNDSRYFQALESVVRELARNQSLVIYGRGGQFILRDHPGALHVLIVAPIEIRIERVMKDLHLDREGAKRETARFDNSIREFIRRYFKAELENPGHYDIVLNTGRFDFQEAVSIVIDALSFGSKLEEPL
jgi:cytidylate kinase